MWEIEIVENCRRWVEKEKKEKKKKTDSYFSLLADNFVQVKSKQATLNIHKNEW